MAQTAAERQATYREKKKTELDEHGRELAVVSIYISKAHRAILSALAIRHGITQGQVLSRMIEESPMTLAHEGEKDDFLSGAASGNIDAE